MQKCTSFSVWSPTAEDQEPSWHTVSPSFALAAESPEPGRPRPRALAAACCHRGLFQTQSVCSTYFFSQLLTHYFPLGDIFCNAIWPLPAGAVQRFWPDVAGRLAHCLAPSVRASLASKGWQGLCWQLSDSDHTSPGRPRACTALTGLPISYTPHLSPLFSVSMGFILPLQWYSSPSEWICICFNLCKTQSATWLWGVFSKGETIVISFRNRA